MRQAGLELMQPIMDNEVRLQLSVLTYNLGNLWRRLGLPQRIKRWLLTRLQHRLMKTGGRLVKHVRYHWLLLEEGHLNRKPFEAMLGRIWVSDGKIRPSERVHRVGAGVPRGGITVNEE